MARRFKVNKARSAKQFRRNVSRTKQINLSTIPMRGGFRL